MNTMLRNIAVVLLALQTLSAQAEGNVVWGRASLNDIVYAPQKVVYDVAVPDVETFSRVLDRVSYLNKLYQANPFEE